MTACSSDAIHIPSPEFLPSYGCLALSDFSARSDRKNREGKIQSTEQTLGVAKGVTIRLKFMDFFSEAPPTGKMLFQQVIRH